LKLNCRRGSTLTVKAPVWAMLVAICAAGLLMTGCGLEAGEDGSSEPSVSVPAAVMSTIPEAEVTSTTAIAPEPGAEAEADAVGDAVDELLQGLGDENEAADALEDVPELD